MIGRVCVVLIGLGCMCLSLLIGVAALLLRLACCSTPSLRPPLAGLLLPSFPPSLLPPLPPSPPPSLTPFGYRSVGCCRMLPLVSKSHRNNKTQHPTRRNIGCRVLSASRMETRRKRRRKLVSMRLADKASKQASSLPPSRMSRLVSKSHRAKVY